MQAQRTRFSRATWVTRLWPRVGLLAFVLLNGCAPGSDLPPIPPYNGGIYRLGVGDQIRLITYGEDQLSE